MTKTSGLRRMRFAEEQLSFKRLVRKKIGALTQVRSRENRKKNLYCRQLMKLRRDPLRICRSIKMPAATANVIVQSTVKICTEWRCHCAVFNVFHGYKGPFTLGSARTGAQCTRASVRTRNTPQLFATLRSSSQDSRAAVLRSAAQRCGQLRNVAWKKIRTNQGMLDFCVRNSADGSAYSADAVIALSQFAYSVV